MTLSAAWTSSLSLSFADSRLRARLNGFIRRYGQDVLELLLYRFDVRVRQVDFIDDRDDGETLLEGLREHELLEAVLMCIKH